MSGNAANAPAGAQPLLSVAGAAISFGGVRAVRDVDLAVAGNEIVSIIGPNGSGKSTLFNLVSGIYRCDAGRILLDGADITGLPADRIARVGLARTFQNIRLFNNLSVIENVMIGAHRSVHATLWEALLDTPALRRREVAAKARAIEAISIFEKRLMPRLDHAVFSLSYANRRRVEIARALALDPKILLLDEPTAGMNPYETAELIEQIVEIRRRGCAIVVIEHKLDVVNRISDRVVALDHGVKIAEGSAQQVRDNPHVIEAYLGRPAATAQV
jgi:ABC-type branched-subunit amino acid transport system ATPase component